jgi:hypothetical protein
MAKRQPPKRLFKSRDVVTPFKNEPTGAKLMKRMADEHEDVLQNIEFVHPPGPQARSPHRRPHRARGAPRRAARRGAGRSPGGGPPEALECIRDVREDVDDDVWRKALQVVDDSVRRHSQLAPGQTSYLSFIAQFVK